MKPITHTKSLNEAKRGKTYVAMAGDHNAELAADSSKTSVIMAGAKFQCQWVGWLGGRGPGNAGHGPSTQGAPPEGAFHHPFSPPLKTLGGNP